MQQNLFAPAIVLFLLYGCSYGYDVGVHVTPISQIPVTPSKLPIEIYFEETQPNHEYTQLAYIEVTGYKYAEVDTLLSVMKAKALALGANAIIFIKKKHDERGRGEVFSTLVDKKNEEQYEAPVLSGVAIKYK